MKEAMQKILTAIALCAMSLSAHASPCVSLADQNMKTMSADELVAETCKASKINLENYDHVMLNLDARQGPGPYPNAQGDFDQCQEQIDRMLRALRTKEVHGKVGDLCKQKQATPAKS